jgi:hypothetical protein
MNLPVDSAATFAGAFKLDPKFAAPSVPLEGMFRFPAVELPTVATLKMRDALPALQDDKLVGRMQEYVVPRDGEPDLKFHGTFLGSAAPDCRDQERWREYRVYMTKGGKYVFSRIGRSILDGERDKFEAAIWNPDNQSESVFESSANGVLNCIGHRAETLNEAITKYFKFDSLAKLLYARLGIDSWVQVD